MASSNPSSPCHFSLAGNLSADDIQELLGAMASEQQHQHHRHRLAPSDVAGFEDDRSSVDRPEEDGMEGGAKAQARSERKRSREKQRRFDVNKQFADLTSLLKQIESEESEEDKTVARLAFSPTNRVDMIARTITHLERLRAINKRRKVEVETLQQQLEQAKKAGEDTAAKLKEVMFNQPPQSKQVMMMVPMMVPTDGSSPYGGGPAAAQMAMMNPFMMPQPYGMMPNMSAAAPHAAQHSMHQHCATSPGYSMMPHQQQAHQPTPGPAANQQHSAPNPAPVAGTPGQAQAPSNSAGQIPILPAGGFENAASGGSNSLIAPCPLSFFMSQQPFMSQAMAATTSQLGAASAGASSAPGTSHVGSELSAASRNDQLIQSGTTSPASNHSTGEGGGGDSKSSPAGQQGSTQGGSNLAHCA